MPLKIREKAKIDPRRKRFALEKVEGQDYALIIDRDAEVEYAAENVVGGRYVARVVEPYARAVCDALNLIDSDHNALLALRPAKRHSKRPQFKAEYGGQTLGMPVSNP